MPSTIAIAISAAALAVSILSLYFARKSWLDSNRPIVTAFVVEHGGGNQGSTFDLVVANTGNRPATHIRLHANAAAITSLLDPEAPRNQVDWMHRIFSIESEIPLLRNGEELPTSFGSFTNDRKWLNYGAQIEIEVTYNDLSGRRLVSHQPLKIFARAGFGGGVWTP
jgi:hypothetical protein